MRRPTRIQRRRTKGWRMPEGAVYVGRPTKWGNPYAVVAVEIVVHPDLRDWWFPGGCAPYEATRMYREDLEAGRLRVTVEDVQRELAGLDLACWCSLDEPFCHATALLKVANP
jgi:hypothetical protein